MKDRFYLIKSNIQADLIVPISGKTKLDDIPEKLKVRKFNISSTYSNLSGSGQLT
jgi:hypothetical protein